MVSFGINTNQNWDNTYTNVARFTIPNKFSIVNYSTTLVGSLGKISVNVGNEDKANITEEYDSNAINTGIYYEIAKFSIIYQNNLFKLNIESIERFWGADTSLSKNIAMGTGNYTEIEEDVGFYKSRSNNNLFKNSGQQ